MTSQFHSYHIYTHYYHSQVVFDFEAASALTDFPRNIVAIQRDSLPQVIRKLKNDPYQQILKFGQDGVFLVSVPWFDEDAVIRVQSKISLEVVHDQCELEVSAQQRDILERLSHEESEVVAVKTMAHIPSPVDRVDDAVSIVPCGCSKDSQLVIAGEVLQELWGMGAHLMSFFGGTEVN